MVLWFEESAIARSPHALHWLQERVQSFIMSFKEANTGKIELIEPTTGKLFFEHKTELIFCKPHLIPLKSQTLERLEEMQRETAQQLRTKFKK